MSTPVGPSVVGDLSDERWLAALEASLDRPEVDGLLFPTFPSEETQRNFVGASGPAALVDAVRFVRYTTNAMSRAGLPAPQTCSIIDFGCGWGRITRALLHSFEPDRVIGVDPLDEMISSCRTMFAPSPVRFEMIDSWPPLPCPEDSVDVIVAFSVFSHLPERVATPWIAEFLRVLKPGGIVVGTTQSRSFIDLCEQMRNDPAYRDSEFLWYQLLARSFVDTKGAKRRFDDGEFLHEAYGAGGALDESLYGDSLFGRRFVEARWSHLLELIRFDDKPYELPQACFVLRKPGENGTTMTASIARNWTRITQSVVPDRARSEAARFARRARRAVRHPSLVVRRLTSSNRPMPSSSPTVTPPTSTPADPATAPVIEEHEGFCPSCDQATTFRVVDAWLRDGYICQMCGSIPRERALAYVLRQLRPDFVDLVIHESSPEWRGTSVYLRDHCHHYIPSYCRPDQPLGAEIGGYRNEDLEALTFDDCSIDLHISQDVLEHVFDLEAAQREIERTLKPGGFHIFTTPLVNRSSPTFRRARRGADGDVLHLAEPVYHGNPIDEAGSLVTFDFGFDLPRLIDRSTGLATTVYVIDNIEFGIRAEYIEVCVSAKPELP